MCRKVLRYVLKFSLVLTVVVYAEHAKYLYKQHRQNYSRLIEITCDIAKDELKKHPEMQTIVLVELENNFPSYFSRRILKCLPADVAKLSVDDDFNDVDAINLTKESMVIYIADIVQWVKKRFVLSLKLIQRKLRFLLIANVLYILVIKLEFSNNIFKINRKGFFHQFIYRSI